LYLLYFFSVCLQADKVVTGVTVLGALGVLGGLAWAYFKGDDKKDNKKQNE